MSYICIPHHTLLVYIIIKIYIERRRINIKPYELLKTEYVICEEIFKFEHENEDVKVDAPFTSSATISGNSEIIPLKTCILQTQQCDNLQIDTTFFVCEDLIIVDEGTGKTTPIKFEFRICKKFTFENCKVDGICNLDKLKCEIVCVCGDNNIKLNPDNNTLSQKLKICFKIRVFKYNEIILDLQCPKFPSCSNNEILS